MATVHLAALAAVWAGGSGRGPEPSREGGVLMISLVAEPIALPGEVKAGVAVGAGVPEIAPVKYNTTPLAAGVAPSPAISAPSAASLAAAATPAPVAVAVPVAESYTAPAFEHRQEPAYPERARRAGAEGEVSVKITLTPRGEVDRVELIRSSGSRWLDEAALAAARSSRFTGAVRNGTPVTAEALATYRFELR